MQKTLEMLNCPYWDDELRLASQEASNFEDLAVVAGKILIKMYKENKNIIMICGPMWSGPLGEEENHKRFEETTKTFVQAGYHVFRQMPFQEAMRRIQEIHGYEYPNKELLEEFYGTIFSMGLIKKLAFIPGWSHSYGATWEYNEAPKHGIKTKILPENYLKTLSSGKTIRGL